MSTADDVIDSIEHALKDWGTSPDAMRWTPGVPPAQRPTLTPLPSIAGVINAHVIPFQEAMRQVQEAINLSMRDVMAEISKMIDAFAKPGRHLDLAGDERRSTMRATYRARARRRTRSHR